AVLREIPRAAVERDTIRAVPGRKIDINSRGSALLAAHVLLCRRCKYEDASTWDPVPVKRFLCAHALAHGLLESRRRAWQGSARSEVGAHSSAGRAAAF